VFVVTVLKTLLLILLLWTKYHINIKLCVCCHGFLYSFINSVVHNNDKLPQNTHVLGRTTTKLPKQDRQNRLWSPMPEGGEP
jgi:hypothetical protein